jgi:hypothetical protein
MKTVIASALLLALLGVPSVARAANTREVPVVVDEAPARSLAEPARSDDAAAEASHYAAREAAAPALGKFKGGGAGIYIGGSALTVILVVVLIVILL